MFINGDPFVQKKQFNISKISLNPVSCSQQVSNLVVWRMERSPRGRSVTNSRKQTRLSPFTTFTTTILAGIAGKGLRKVS